MTLRSGIYVQLSKTAAATVVPFGQFNGMTIDKIAETDDGLRYIDWLSGEEIRRPVLREAIHVYVSDKTIAKEIGNLER